MQSGSATIVITRPANAVVWVIVWLAGTAVLVWSALAGPGGGAPLAALGGTLGVVMALAVPLGSVTFVRDGQVRNGLRRRWIDPGGADGIAVDQPLPGQFRPVAIGPDGERYPIGGPITAFAGKARRQLNAEDHVDAVRAALTEA